MDLQRAVKPRWQQLYGRDDALGNFYGVTGYGDAFVGAMVYEITPRINPRIGRRLSGCVRSCKTLLDNCTNWQQS